MPLKNPIKEKPRFRVGYKNIKKVINNKFSSKQIKVIAALLVLLVLYLFRDSLFVALVNGVPVTRIEFTKQLEQTAGKDTLENLITEKLIQQEIKKQGVVISDVEVTKEIANFELVLENQGSTLDDALALQGQTKEDLEKNIRMQKTIQKILENKTTVTEQEIKDYFENNSQLFEEDAVFDELKEDIRQQITNEKLNAEYGNWITKLREESNIIYFVKY